MFKKIAISSLVFAGSLFSADVFVAAAANVSNPIKELEVEFKKKHPGVSLEINFGASGKFNAQIKEGASYDVFLSADMAKAQDLEASGQAVTKTIKYAVGKVAVFSKKGIKSLEEVANRDCISIANPATAPYGEASVAALKKANLWEKVEKKVVQADSISGVTTAALEACDVGFMAGSAVYADKLKGYKEGEHYFFLDASLHAPIEQGIVLLKHGENNEKAKSFYDFILSAEAKAVFARFGYGQ